MLRPGTRSGRSIDWLTTTNLGTSTKVDEKVGKRGAGGGGGGGGGVQQSHAGNWEEGRKRWVRFLRNDELASGVGLASNRRAREKGKGC